MTRASFVRFSPILRFAHQASKEERPVSNAFAGLTLDDDDDEEEEEQAAGEANETKAEE